MSDTKLSLQTVTVTVVHKSETVTGGSALRRGALLCLFATYRAALLNEVGCSSRLAFVAVGRRLALVCFALLPENAELARSAQKRCCVYTEAILQTEPGKY